MKIKIPSIVPAIELLIVDDHYIFRDGLKTLLMSFKRELIIHVQEAGSGELGLQMAEHQHYDLVIVDYKLSGMSGDEFVRRLLRFRPDVKVLVLSHFNEYNFIEAMMEAGALGYVLKNILPEQLLQAIRTVLIGRNYYCNEIALVLLTKVKESAGAKKAAQYHLSAREIEVLFLIADGMRNEEIARKLFVARRTVDTHRQNLLKKLKVNNTAGLVRFALELKTP